MPRRRQSLAETEGSQTVSPTLLEIEAGGGSSTAASAKKRTGSHKRGQGQASQATVKAIAPWVAFGLQAASEMGASRLQLPEIALEAPRDESGAPTDEPGEADILALLPSRLLAKTMLGKQLAKVLLDEEQKATLAVLVAYGLRVGPAVIERVRENNVARRQNAQPRRTTAEASAIPVQPAAGRPAIIPVPSGGLNGRGAAANGAGGYGAGDAIPVPHI